jgi:hypothetical protein
MTLGESGQEQAARDRGAIDEDRARTTHPDAASLAGTGESDLVPKDLEQGVVDPRPDDVVMIVHT